MSRKHSLLIHTATLLACSPPAPSWSQRPFVQCFRGPPRHSHSHRDVIPIPPPPPPQKKQSYLLHEAAAAPARSAAAARTAAIPLSLNHCSNKLPFPVFPFIHKGSHRQERQVETTFLLEEVGSLLRNDWIPLCGSLHIYPSDQYCSSAAAWAQLQLIETSQLVLRILFR